MNTSSTNTVHDLESFIEAATEKHNGLYSYEKAVYVNAHTKLIITHPEHGDHLMTPNAHLQGKGHPRVNFPVHDLESFIKAATEKHDGLYSYEKAVYVGSQTKLTITHPELGDHEITPSSHLQGNGHPRTHFPVHDLESFIRKATEVHKGDYSYEKAVYLNSQTKLIITHKELGDHKITPANHLRGTGHPVIGNQKNANSKRKTIEQFIKDAKKIHGDLYDYTKAEYINTSTKIEIIHPVHGSFWQTPANHLRGQGHPVAGRRNISKSLRLTTEEFIERAKKVHNGLYDYRKVEYVNNSTKVIITHPELGDHLIRPADHLKGQGHPGRRKYKK